MSSHEPHRRVYPAECANRPQTPSQAPADEPERAALDMAWL